MSVSCAATFTLIVALTQTGAGTAPQTKTALEQIDRAAASMFSEEPGRSREGFEALMGAAGELAQQVQGAPAIASNIKVAREQLRSETEAQKASESLQAAYKALTGGSAFAMPLVEELADMAAHMKRRLESARTAVAGGQVRDGLRHLLEVALMATTPIQQ
jgi:hypothetical protein